MIGGVVEAVKSQLSANKREIYRYPKEAGIP